MTQEEKQLLLLDLCARLPYGVIINDNLHNMDLQIEWVNPINGIITGSNVSVPVEEVRPYLRPMPSMTEEEHKEAKANGCIIYHDTSPKNKGLMVIASPKGIDWLNKKMFAYRTIDGEDMFKLGLALEAHEGMYDLKKK